MDASIEKAFKEAGNFVFKEREALGQCSRLATEHNLKPADIARHYDAFAAVRDSSFSVSVANVQVFAKFLGKEMEAGNRARQALATKPRIIHNKRDEPFESQPTPKRSATGAAAMKENMHTPMAGARTAMTTPNYTTHRSPLQATPGTTTKFSERVNKGQVVTSLNGSLDVPKAHKGLPSFQLLVDPLVPDGKKFLHMMDTIEGKIESINGRIVDFGRALRRALPGDESAADANTTNVSAMSQEPVWCVGRVIPESTNGSLNDKSVLLEGSLEASKGARVKLDLSAVPHFRIFPGQVIAARGLNPEGSTLIAQSIVTHLPPPAAPGAAAQATPPPAPRGTSMVVAAGPFTTMDNLLYEPLTELLRSATELDASTVVLMGPFVDVEHPVVRSADLDVPFAVIMREQVVSRVAEWQAHPANVARRVVVMPAGPRDVASPAVHPTPPLSLPGMPAERTSSVQSPAVFALDGVSVGGTSHDVLLHLSANELWRGATSDRMSALASHIVGQRSFYPLYPPPLGACLDTSHYDSVRLSATPSVLLLPSNLAPFAKLIGLGQEQLQGAPSGGAPATGAPEALVAINPGRLSKGVSGGTFAHISVLPGSQPLHQRTRVDICRL